MYHQDEWLELYALIGKLDFKKIPHLHLTTNELRVIGHVLSGYSGYLQSQGYTKHLRLLEDMRRVQQHLIHIVLQLVEEKEKGGIGPVTGITFDDLETISDALIGSIRNLPRVAPKSEARDEMLQVLRQLRERIQGLIDAILANTP